MAHRILMIEDDARLAEMVAEYLGQAELDVVVAPTGAEGRAQFERSVFDALILDVMLPDADGFDLCREFRNRSRVPIVMLTARGEETDRIVGLELGADDYLPKPFNPRELLARLRAVLRRSESGAADSGDVLRFGRLEIDRGARAVRLDGSRRELTSHQYELLVCLAENAGRVMSRETLMQRVRGRDLEVFDRSIDVHISRIRGAIEDDPKAPRRVITVRGAGYVFTGEVEG